MPRKCKGHLKSNPDGDGTSQSPGNGNNGPFPATWAIVSLYYADAMLKVYGPLRTLFCSTFLCSTMFHYCSGWFFPLTSISGTGQRTTQFVSWILCLSLLTNDCTYCHQCFWVPQKGGPGLIATKFTPLRGGRCICWLCFLLFSSYVFFLVWGFFNCSYCFSSNHSVFS